MQRIFQLVQDFGFVRTEFQLRPGQLRPSERQGRRSLLPDRFDRCRYEPTNTQAFRFSDQRSAEFQVLEQFREIKAHIHFNVQ
jgi:hypothetical protein